MEEQKCVVTLARRKKLAQVTSGAIASIPKISKIAFGSGGVDAGGIPMMPLSTQTSLVREFCRYSVSGVTYPEETTARYTVVIPRGEQGGQEFNEMALVDEAGSLCMIKNMYTKCKDEDVVFTFEFDDEF